MHKKAWCTCKAVVLLIKPIAFFAALVAVAVVVAKAPLWPADYTTCHMRKSVLSTSGFSSVTHSSRADSINELNLFSLSRIKKIALQYTSQKALALTLERLNCACLRPCIVPMSHYSERPKHFGSRGPGENVKNVKMSPARSPRIRHRSELTERDWEKDVQGLDNLSSSITDCYINTDSNLQGIFLTVKLCLSKIPS